MKMQSLIEGRDRMNRKYIHYDNPEVYALYYRETNTIYYNMDFGYVTHIILFK